MTYCFYLGLVSVTFSVIVCRWGWGISNVLFVVGVGISDLLLIFGVCINDLVTACSWCGYQ